MTFSLKTLFIAVTVSAVLLAVFFALPFRISLFVCGVVSVVAPAGFVAWIVYGRGYGRAFAIGCTATSAIMLFSMGLDWVLFTQWSSVGAPVTGEATLIPLLTNDYRLDRAALTSVFAILFTPYPLAFALVLLSGGLSALVRWLTLRERCLLE